MVRPLQMNFAFFRSGSGQQFHGSTDSRPTDSQPAVGLIPAHRSQSSPLDHRTFKPLKASSHLRILQHSQPSIYRATPVAKQGLAASWGLLSDHQHSCWFFDCHGEVTGENAHLVPPKMTSSGEQKLSAIQGCEEDNSARELTRVYRRLRSQAKLDLRASGWLVCWCFVLPANQNPYMKYLANMASVLQFLTVCLNSCVISYVHSM